MTEETSPPLPPPSDASDPAAGYRVKLEVFEGPLDLLLHLIRKHEMDIFDIQVAKITEQYLLYVDIMKELDLDVAGEFVVMAATLVHIKTRMLLPRSPEEEEGPEAEDPRQELVQRLIEHQRYKAAATALYQREIIQDRVWGRPITAMAEAVEEGEPLVEVSLFDLLSSLRDIIERARTRIAIEVEPERFSVAEKIQYVADQLAEISSIVFEKLFEEAQSRREIIVTFLALLEMIRLRMIRVLQRESFGTIWVLRRDVATDDGEAALAEEQTEKGEEE